MIWVEPVTVQQHSRQPIDNSDRVKSLCIMVQLEPLTVQKHSRQLVDSSVRNYSPSRQFSYIYAN